MIRAALAERRKLGAYYTPQRLADLLSRWAVREPTDTVLEPSFGGCSFVDGAHRRLRELGNSQPNAQLFGCDIDKTAFGHLFSKLGLTQLQGHFIQADFLALRPSDLAVPAVNAVVGNPPYVRHHAMDSSQKQRINEVRNRWTEEISRRSNLWVYFLLHSMQFLCPSGRMALILPPSLRHADYSKALYRILVKHFEATQIISLGEHMFRSEGAHEGTVILLADGWQQAPNAQGTLTYSVASDMRELEGVLNTERQNPPNCPKQSAFELVAGRAAPLGSICKFSIGVVTGNSKFFLFNASKVTANQIPQSELKWIVSRAAQLSGLRVTRRSLKAKFLEGERTKILHANVPFSAAARRYLSTMTTEENSSNITFRKKKKWFQPVDRDPPDAFFVCMSHIGPRIVLNNAAVPCTNSIYELSFTNKLSTSGKEIIAIALLTTFSQLSAEFCGRQYGAGLLKHEPSDAANIMLVLPSHLPRQSKISEIFRKIDRALKARLHEAAVRIADTFFIESGLFTIGEVENLRVALEQRRLSRMKRRS